MSSITEKDIEEIQENGYRIRSLKCSDGVTRKILIMSRETAQKAEIRLHDFLNKTDDIYTFFYLGDESETEELTKIAPSSDDGSVVTPRPPEYVVIGVDGIVEPKSAVQEEREYKAWEEKLGRL